VPNQTFYKLALIANHFVEPEVSPKETAKFYIHQVSRLKTGQIGNNLLQQLW